MKNTFSIIFLLVSHIAFPQASPKSQQNIYVYNQLAGVEFPTLELEDTSGNIISTASLKGKTIYVDFWFTQCPPCLREIPFAQSLQSFFKNDSNIVFLNICIENIERKQAWKKMIKEKQLGGIHLFYARNRPQRVNLLRQYKVYDFPTYMLVNNAFEIIGYDAPAPSQQYWVQWALQQATKNVSLAEAYKRLQSKEFLRYTDSIKPVLEGLRVTQ